MVAAQAEQQYPLSVSTFGRSLARRYWKAAGLAAQMLHLSGAWAL